MIDTLKARVFLLAVSYLLVAQSHYLWGDIRVPVYSYFQSEGEYFVNISIGEPPHVFRLQIDTGSSDLGVPKWGCPSCGRHASNRYVPNDSKSSRPVNCSSTTLKCELCHRHVCAYQISYADDSGYQAQLYHDRVSFSFAANDTSVLGIVGGMYSQRSPKRNPMQPEKVDGIIGLAFPSVSTPGSPTIIDNLALGSKIDDVFSLCLNRDKGGALYLGSPKNNDLYSNGMQWTPLKKKTYYVVNLVDILLNNESIGVKPAVYNRGDCIIDSGTSGFTLPRPAFDAFRNSLLKFCDNTTTSLVGVCTDQSGRKIERGRGMFEGNCYELTGDDIAKFPTLYVKFEGTSRLAIEPDMYLRSGRVFCPESGKGGTKKYTLGLDSGSVSGGTLMGDVFMSSYLIVFDRRGQGRIGFANAKNNCFD